MKVKDLHRYKQIEILRSSSFYFFADKVIEILQPGDFMKLKKLYGKLKKKWDHWKNF